jgi:hypothetical protein
MEKGRKRRGKRECTANAFLLREPFLAKALPLCLFLSLTLPVVTLSPPFTV